MTGKFVVVIDGGYLLARGGSLLAGRRVGRSSIDINPEKMVRTLRRKGEDVAEGAALLRVYWYDAARPAGPSGLQNYIAMADDVKLRVGRLAKGRDGVERQKGVDTLIVADMIELAQNRAASDFILLTGDDDLRVGVPLVQKSGARVSLLGVAPAMRSQSQHLRREADALFELSFDDLAEFMKLAPDPDPLSVGDPASKWEPRGAITNAVERFLDSYTIETWRDVHSRQIQEFVVPWVVTRLMAVLEESLGRRLIVTEREQSLRMFKRFLSRRVAKQ